MNQYYPILPEEIELAKKVAYSKSKGFVLVDKEDVYSGLTEWLYANSEAVVQHREDGNTGWLYTSLRNEAIRLSKKETRDIIHRDLDDGNLYTVKFLSNILPTFFKIDFYELEMSADSNSLSYNIAADINSAYWGLKAEQRELIDLRYKLGLSPIDIANKFQIEENAASKRVGRALSALSSRLSGGTLEWIREGTINYPEF